ncbi:penicillin-binding transpeptidase domain-containing protein [Peribacillus sp. NPDC097264]|uniref:penicillin-binding transpeptidase domain-containing protein n=1 Tax=Peribacillus sp. NPDC097264 TaxID=3390616 RepID=UPI003D04A996
MKRLALVFGCLLMSVLFLAGCSEEPSPEERFAAYTKLWNKQDFAKMYDYLSADTKKQVSADEFAERYKKIYKGIEANQIKVGYTQPKEEEAKEHKDDEKVKLAYTVDMNTLAGAVSSDHKATLVKEERDKEENWYIKWDESYIFPDLKAGEKISVESYPAIRGEIVDRNERGLAMNGTVSEIGIVPEKMGDKKATVKQVAGTLNMTTDEVEKKLNQSWVQPSYFVPIKQISSDETATLDKLLSIPGVSANSSEERIYPYKKATAHLIGYVGEASAEDLEKLKGKGYTANDVIGKRGLEQILEERLKGKPGGKIFIKTEEGEEKIIAEKPAEEGETITLTIDAELQKDIFKQYDNEAGSAAALDPNTGETLALVSSPSFDPNKYVLGITNAEQKALEDDPDKPLLNRFSSTFAPGSTIKALTAAIELKNGIDPKAALSIQGTKWAKSNWKDHSITRVSNPGVPIDMEKALIYSDNIYFAQQALKLGKDKFSKGLQDFGFDESLNFDYPIKASSIGKLDSEGRLADASYGQAQVQMSTLHLAMTYSAFLNEGNIMAPSLVTGDKTEKKPLKENIISADQATTITKMLTQVVEHPKGTAHDLNDLGVKLATKTGTAETKASKNSSGTENGWLVAMDTEDPELIMAWMMEDVKGRGGSHLVSDKMKPVLKKYLK